MINDRILAVKFLHRFEPVRRGDVIVNSARDFDDYDTTIERLPGTQTDSTVGGSLCRSRPWPLRQLETSIAIGPGPQS